MSNSVAVTLSPATIEALASVVATAVVNALGSAQVVAQSTVVSHPEPKARARRSTKPQPKAEAKVQRFVTEGSLFEATLGGVPAGRIVALRATGAQYRVGQLTTEGVELIHPSGEVYHYPASRVVFEVA